MKKLILFLVLLFPLIGFSQSGEYDILHLKLQLRTPTNTQDKLYNISHHIYFNGVRIDSTHEAISNTWTHEIAISSQDTVTVPFTLQNNSIVIFNGSILRNSQWSGVGSSSLILALDTREYDFITIKQ
jgi:hypothetical protein